MSLVKQDENDSNFMDTKLAEFRKVKFFKIQPPEVIPDIEYIPTEKQNLLSAPPIKKKPKKLIDGYKEEKLIRYKYNPNDWKLNKQDQLFSGSIELHELQKNDILEDTESSLDEGMFCKLLILPKKFNDKIWGEVLFEKLYDPETNLPIKNYNQSDQFYTIQRIIPQHYVIFVKSENGTKIGLGMILHDFFDDIRLNTNLREFEDRFRKLQQFKDNFGDDSNPNTMLKTKRNEKFNIDDDDESDEDFGDFVSS
ncbi:hypothetical protein CANARDRAFT_194665 [[Candida] arabinofermentans NRRL YB-2248]|uniref:NECAP PHear domain-containing protein n=1 Tax=[Candida] arabinofermentans NRRL YB-2248 TaxID=983967 RepID=A0A1E4T5V9_9ASCO|nr:hypothetical protein CANARDRAFT_194665 [[Candida] arabinofermentans NRRL YB-2248]